MPEITLSLAKKLINTQFPQWSHLPISPVAYSGWDNRTFHLGKDMSIRLPSSEEYASQPEKEQRWLPLLAKHLPLPIPEPIALGNPSKEYPWNWSVYKWIEGDSANTLIIDDLDLQYIAFQLAQFLNELHKIDITDAPQSGLHNFYRGSHPSKYDTETRLSITQLKNIIDVEMTTAVWNRAMSSTWSDNHVWIHGDFSSGNFLINKRKVTAVIDFGCMSVGDPACDLVIAWTFFFGENRKVFQSNLNLDSNTWARARGWALWKACFELKKLKDKKSFDAEKQKKIIFDVINEHLKDSSE